MEGHIFWYTEPFLTILASFESPQSQLSNETKIVKNGSVQLKIGPSEVVALVVIKTAVHLFKAVPQVILAPKIHMHRSITIYGF